MTEVDSGKVIEETVFTSNVTFTGLSEGFFYDFRVKSAGKRRSNDESSEVFTAQTGKLLPVKFHFLILEPKFDGVTALTNNKLVKR